MATPPRANLSREEPDAGNLHVRVCEGWGRQRPHLLGTASSRSGAMKRRKGASLNQPGELVTEEPASRACVMRSSMQPGEEQAAEVLRRARRTGSRKAGREDIQRSPVERDARRLRHDHVDMPDGASSPGPRCGARR